MAELQVGIRADVSEAKRVTRALKDIKREAGGTATSLAAAGASADKTSVSLKTTTTASGQLAAAQNLASVANASAANTLKAVSAAATKTTATEAATTAQTSRLTAAMLRLKAASVGIFAGPTAGLKRFGTQARTAAGSVVGLSTAAAGAGAAIAVGLGVGIKSAVTFEKTLSRIEGLVGIASAEVEAFKQPILDLAKATAKGPNELAEALFFVTSAGFEGKEALDVLEASAKAAAAGLGETKQVADAVTSAVNAYGIENLSASRSTDILVATVREGKAEADSIAGALGQVLPAASELGVEFEELGGTIAALTRIGLGADQGATALGATLAAIQKPGDQAKKTLLKFGTSASELRRKVADEGLLVALQDLQERFGDNEEALTEVFPNIRALRAILPLVGKNAGDVAKIFESVADSVNSTDDAFEAYKKTTSFELNEALVALQVSLQKIGEVLLPAVAKAFVTLASAVEKTVDLFDGLGKAVAEALNGSDDAYVRAFNRQKELNDALKDLTLGQEIITGFDELGRPIRERLGEMSEFDKVLTAAANRAFGLAGLDVSGLNFDEQVEALREAVRQQNIIVEQMDREMLPAVRRTNTALEETVDVVEEIADVEVPAPIDEEMLKKGQNALLALSAEVGILEADLENLRTLGKDGLGLAEDGALAAQIFKQLQGQSEMTKDEIFALIQTKRELETAINDINAAFARQDAALDFLDELKQDTADVAQQFRILQGGGSLIEIQTIQQAEQIFSDLAGSTDDTVESITQLILVQEAYNTALKQLDPSGLQDLVAQRDALIAQQAAFAEGTVGYDNASLAIGGLNDAIINAGLAAEGLPAIDEIMLSKLPKEEQFAEASSRLRDAFDAAGIIDPDADPRFQAALENLKAKIFGLNNIFEEFGKAAAQNLQSSFSDFLFDPFEDGLDGMASKFADTLKRLASDLLANQILTSFLNSIAGFGGGIGGVATAALGGLQGSFASGGDFAAGKPMLVGERGPEVITPRRSGSVIPNDMMGGAMSAPEVNVAGPTIVNTIDDGQIVAAFNKGGGGQVVLNDMTERKAAYRQALGIN